MSRILYEPFNIQKHKEHFIDYLEIVVLEDGAVEYAVPSHQEKMISLCCKKLSVTRDELNDMCPVEYYMNFMEWLCKISGAIPVWFNFFMGTPNAQQIETLRILKEEGLYAGEIPNLYR
jgi:hypothetical protein